MEQFGLALILFAAFWVGCAAGYIAMRLRAQVAYERGRNESAAEISSLSERLNSRDLQFTETKQRADTLTESVTRLEVEVRAEADRRNVAEARLTLLPRYEAELELRGKKLAEQQTELTKLHVTASELGARLEEAKRSSDEKISALQALQNRATESFQAMSAEALMSNNKAFLDLAGDALTRLQDSARGDLDQRQSLLGQILDPLKSSLERVDSRITELERERANAYAGLQQQVESMMRTQVSLQAETSHLASALRTPSSRGRWGEVQLRRVVELAGMISHCDFIEPRATEEGGASGRPDLIVQLPNFRQIVVDSKISLSAYLESNDATDEPTRIAKRREHAAQVRAHVTQLSAKGYWDQFPQSPEFVVAFLPGESFFSAALEHDPELLEFGVERRVILATPTTLIALLRAVAWGWKQELVSSNAREIRDLGKALYDRLRSLADNFTEVQRGLSRTTAAFNRTVGTFESTVIPSARRMRELGASTGDEIVSPPPVDFTPRSLQLLSEATEPVLSTEAEPVEALQAPLAKIAVPSAAGAQPRAASIRQGVDPATAKTSHPVPVNHTAFEQQKPAPSAPTPAPQAPRAPEPPVRTATALKPAPAPEPAKAPARVTPATSSSQPPVLAKPDTAPVAIAKPAPVTAPAAPAEPPAPEPTPEPVAVAKPAAPVEPPVPEPAPEPVAAAKPAAPAEPPVPEPAPEPVAAAKPAAPAEPPVPAPAPEPVPVAAVSEPAAPVTFVLSTLPSEPEPAEVPPPPVAEIPAATPEAEESLKALAALYTAKPNGAAETANGKAIETPVAVAS